MAIVARRDTPVYEIRVIAAKIPMIEMTTRSSIIVNPWVSETSPTACSTKF